MNHYIDIRLRPDPEFSPPLLMNALYNKFHRALFDLEANDIGISFPEHKRGVKARTLGKLARVHATEARLQALMTMSWLSGMNDHVECAEMRPVPADAKYCFVKRTQFNTGSESRAKRYASRHPVTLEEARAIYAELVERRIELPFAQINSRSTGQKFCLFIEHGKPLPEAVSGTFSRYGLSNGATVPCF